MSRQVKTIGFSIAATLILVGLSGMLSYNAGYQAGVNDGQDAEVEAAKRSCDETNTKLQKLQDELKSFSQGPNQ